MHGYAVYSAPLPPIGEHAQCRVDLEGLVYVSTTNKTGTHRDMGVGIVCVSFFSCSMILASLKIVYENYITMAVKRTKAVTYIIVIKTIIGLIININIYYNHNTYNDISVK